MGQAHMVVNLTRKEFIFPHNLGDGYKLMEFGHGGGTMLALAVLLAASCKGGARGGGDIDSQDRLIGRWAGDKIAIIGDYQEPEDVPGLDPMDAESLWKSNYNEDPTSSWVNISPAIRQVLMQAGEFEENGLFFRSDEREVRYDPETDRYVYA